MKGEIIQSGPILGPMWALGLNTSVSPTQAIFLLRVPNRHRRIALDPNLVKDTPIFTMENFQANYNNKTVTNTHKKMQTKE